MCVDLGYQVCYDLLQQQKKTDTDANINIKNKETM